jgi:predicted DNA-binding transcriptional regulator YafY
MYYNETLSAERNARINKLIRLILTAQARGEIINKTTLKNADLGSPATLGRELALIGDAGEQIVTFDKHQITFRMNKDWKKSKHITVDSMRNYTTLAILKSLLNQYQNTPVYDKIIGYIENLTEMPISDFSRIAVPPRPEYNKADQAKFSRILDYMNRNCKIQFYYKGKYDKERKNRIVHPYQLLLEDGTCYLYGYDETRQDVRMFVLRRMEQIRFVGKTFDLPADFEFSVRHGFSKFGAYTFKEPVKYKIEFYRESQVWVGEKQWADDQVIEEMNGKTVLSFTSSQDDRILAWILSCGADARPVAPKYFVQRWKDKISSMSKLAGIKKR